MAQETKASRDEMIATIKTSSPHFRADGKSDDYLRGRAERIDRINRRSSKPATESAPPVVTAPSGPPATAHAKLDEEDINLRAGVLVAAREARVRNATAWCTTDEQRKAAVARMDARDEEEALRKQERDARMANNLRLDANSDALPPVVRARIQAHEAQQRRSSGPLNKWNGFGTDPDPEAA